MHNPIEAVLQEFHAMFNGPLPYVNVALNKMFNLDDDEAGAMDNTLISMVGDGVDNLPEVTW